MKTAGFAWDQLLRAVRVAVETDYDVIRSIGVGGIANVYLARRKSDGCDVALKVVHPALMSDSTVAARVEREARTMARLEHPHIARVHDVLRRDGLLCLVMPYFAGGPLARVVARYPNGLPYSIALHWLAQIGSAVTCAHDAGVLHRDLNTSNVLLDGSARAFVADFGIAYLAGEARLTAPGVRIGTPEYASPEQLADRTVTPASDQYSLGVIAYEMIAGSRPFYGSTGALAKAHRTRPPAPLTELRPDCPPHLAGAVARMLDKNPADRFANVADAVSAMHARPLSPGDPHYDRLRDLAAVTAPPDPSS